MWASASASLANNALECVSKREIRKFEWIFRQFKEEIRRLSSAKSRIDDAEMAEKTPKLRIKEFLRHTLVREHQSVEYIGRVNRLAINKHIHYAVLVQHQIPALTIVIGRSHSQIHIRIVVGRR